MPRTIDSSPHTHHIAPRASALRAHKHREHRSACALSHILSTRRTRLRAPRTPFSKAAAKSAAGQNPARAQALRARTPACVKVLRAKALCASQSATGSALRTLLSQQRKPHRHRRRDRALRAQTARAREPCGCSSAAGNHWAQQKHPSNYPRRPLSESSPEKRIGENPKRHLGGAGLIRTHRI